MKTFFLFLLFLSATSYAGYEENIRKEFCSYFKNSPLSQQKSYSTKLQYKEKDFSDAFTYMIRKYDGEVMEWCTYEDRGDLGKLISSVREKAYSDCYKMKDEKREACKSFVSQQAEKMSLFANTYQTASAQTHNELVLNNCGSSVNESSRNEMKEVSDKLQKSVAPAKAVQQ